MDYNKLVNDNGVYLYEDHDCNTIDMEFCFHVGDSERDQAIRSILKRFLEKSNQVISDIDAKSKELYYLNYNIGLESIGPVNQIKYTINMISPNKLGIDYYEEALQFIRDLLMKPDFTNQQLFERVKRNLISRIKYSLSSPEKRAGKLYKAMVFNDSDNFSNQTDLDHITELIESITIEEVENAYKQSINNDSFFRGIVYGDITPEQFKKLREYLPFKTDKEIPDYSQPTTITEEDTEIGDANTNESIVVVTYDIAPMSAAWTEVLWSMFNGGEGICSEILREKYGLVYEGWASLYTKRNLVYFYAKIKKENKQKLLDAIDEIVAAIQDPEQLREYLEIGKDYLKKEAYILSEKKDKMFDSLNDYVRGVDDGLDYNEFIANLDSYTDEKVAGMLQTLRRRNVFMYRGDK